MTQIVEPTLSIAASTVATVANEFLHLGELEPNFPSVDQMKLQKLLFYAHAWYLAIYNKPLFDTDFEAWPWGPVVRDVYYQTRKYGVSAIKEPIKEIQKTGDNSELSDFNFVIPQEVRDHDLKNFIKSVWDVHKRYTGVQLSNSTHAPGEPWTIIKERFTNLDHKPTIPNDLIAAVFKRKLKNVSPANTTAI